MGLHMGEAIDDMRARPFQTAALQDVRGLVKAGFQFHKGRDRLAVLGSLAQSRDDGAVVAGAIQGLLDRQHIGIARRLFQKADHHVEGLVRVMQQHVLLPDGGEHVAVMVQHAFRNARLERRPQQVGALGQHQFLQVGNPEQATQFHHLVAFDAQFFHDQRFQIRRRTGGKLQADHLAPAPTFQRGFKLAHQIFGLVLDFKVAVAEDTEAAMAPVGIAGEQHAKVDQQQLFQRQEAVLARAAGQRDEAGDLLGDRQQGLQWAVVGQAFQFQRKGKSGVGDEGKRMGGVDGQRREDRENLGKEMLFKEFQIAQGEFGARQDDNPLTLHFLFQFVQHGLLILHQPPRVGMDQI